MSQFYFSNLVLIQATFTGLLLALSIQVPIRMGVFSFAGAGAYGIGCYAGAIFVLDHGFTSVPTILITCAITGVVVLLVGLLIQKLNGLYLAMATVAFCLIISVIAINGGETTGGSTGRYGVISDFTMGAMITFTVIAVVLVALSERGRLGRRVDAVREDPELAASMGINVRRYRVVAFAVSGVLGGLAGSMNILVRSAVSPLDIGFHLIVLALTMIIVGGTLSWKGAVIGALIFTWLPDLLQVVGQWQELIYGIIVALAAVLLPRGLYGIYVDTKRSVLRKRREKADAAKGANSVDARASNSDPSTDVTTTPEMEAQR